MPTKKATEPKTKKAAAPKAKKSAETTETVTEKTAPKQQTMKIGGDFIYASGKRKTSVARVRLYQNGNDNIVMNGKSLEEYLATQEQVGAVKTPLRLTGHLKTFEISIKTEGGGINSQAEAARHGISKALLEFDPSLRLTLKRAGLLTRDPRMKERKKYGLHRARRAPQWSKR